MLSRSLGIYKRTNLKETLVKICPMCNNEFEIVVWEQKGISKDRKRGWHKRIYCDTCAPQRAIILDRERKRKSHKKIKSELFKIDVER